MPCGAIMCREGAPPWRRFPPRRRRASAPRGGGRGWPRLRLCLDRTGQGEELLFVLWLREEDGLPVLGEIVLEEEIILQARFTNFEFGGILSNQDQMG